MSIIRIAITGPESTGKSMLSEQLAGYYNTIWVPEYSREYLYGLDRDYNYDDILSISKGQLQREKEALPLADRFLFCDTEAIVTKIWCDVKYGACHDWILDQIKFNPYALYLLCDIDLPWEDDPLREHPDKRTFLFNLYYKELKERDLPFHVISGLGDSRLKEAIKIVDRSF
jgi:NadR type nicotinamide-nucleotide adenylyltransferase